MGTSFPSGAAVGSKPQSPSRKVLVMGLTGAGKSTFINSVAGSTLTVGAGIQSCTQIASRVSFCLEDGTWVELMDTPGFDDSVRSELQVLESTVRELQSWAPEGIHAIIYIHRISDHKLSGSALRAFDIFFKMCGTTALVMKRMAIVTNMWDIVSPELGETREAEIKCKDALLFKRALDLGAKLYRNNNPPVSAFDVVRALAGRDSFSEPLRLTIQRELEGGIPLPQTLAGEAISHEMSRKQAEHEAELKALNKQYEKARQDHDIEAEEEIREERRLMERELEEMRLTETRLRQQVEQKVRPIRVERVTYGQHPTSHNLYESPMGQGHRTEFCLVLGVISTYLWKWRKLMVG